MKFSKTAKIELVASKDFTRQSLTNVWFDGKRLCATDGHAMAIVPVQDAGNDGDHAGWVSVDAIKAARKAGKRGETVLLANGEIKIPGGPSFERPISDVTPPPYDQVVPAHRPDANGTVTIALNPRLLWDLAQAIGAGEDVLLTFPVCDASAVMMDPIVVTTERDQAIGVLMPCRRGFAKGGR